MKYALHFDPETMVIQMEGDFTFQDTRAFHQMLNAIINNGTREQIRLDIQQLSSIDATALRLLMMVHDAAKQVHCVLVFYQPQGQVLHALKEASRYNMLHIAG